MLYESASDITDIITALNISWSSGRERGMVRIRLHVAPLTTSFCMKSEGYGFQILELTVWRLFPSKTVILRITSHRPPASIFGLKFYVYNNKNIAMRKTCTSYCDNFGENWPVSKAPWLIFWAYWLSLLSWGKVSWDRKAGHHGFSIQLLILVYEECLKYCWNLFHYTKKAQWFQPISELPQYNLPLEQNFMNNKLLSNNVCCSPTVLHQWLICKR